MIHKHTVTPMPGDWAIEHGLGAHVISAGFQGDQLVVWTAGNTMGARAATTMVYVRFTGDDAPKDAKHLATLTLDAGTMDLVFHVFV